MPENETPPVAETAPEATQENPARGEALKGLSSDELVELALKYRDEAAASRVKGKKEVSEATKRLEEDAKKWQEHLDSQKTDFEKERDRANKLEEDLKEFRTDKLRSAVAKSVEGFPADLVDFLHGDEASMTATAKRLAEREKKRLEALGDVSHHAGNRGTPLVPSKERGGGGFLEELDPQRRR